MEFKFSSDTRHLKSLDLSRESLKRLHVEIGLPSSASPRNRWLLALHERGAPGAHIPPRPVVAPALSQPGTQAAIQSGLLSACEAASEGDAAGVQSGFERAGEAGVEGIADAITGQVYVPNIPVICSWEEINDLLFPFRFLFQGSGIGSLFCLKATESPSSQNPGRMNLSEFQLIWGDILTADSIG